MRSGSAGARAGEGPAPRTGGAGHPTRPLVVQPTGDKRGHDGLYATKLCQAIATLDHEGLWWTGRPEDLDRLAQAWPVRPDRGGGNETPAPR